MRLGPNYYSFDDPETTKIIYGHGTKFTKSAWYDAWNPSPDLLEANTFAQRNVQQHASARRRLANIYAMSSLVSYEPYVNNCMALFNDKLKTYAREGGHLDFTKWFQLFAFDVIGEITVRCFAFNCLVS